MTQEEIRAAREKIDRRVAELKLEIEKERIGYKLIQLDCKHPDGYSYSIMGRDTGWKCPDCGDSR